MSSDIKTGIFILKNHPGCCIENCPGEEGAGRSLGGGSRRLVPGSRWQRWSSGRRDEWDPKERGGPGRLLHTTGFASVTERGVGPISTIKSQETGQAGGKKVYFRCQQLVGAGRGHLSKGQLPAPPPATRQPVGQELLWTELGRGLHAVRARSALTVIFKLVIGGLTGVILVALSPVNLHFQGPFVPFL